MDLAKKIRAIREAETSGRQEFCYLLGVNKGTLTRIEQTGQVPKGGLHEGICRWWPKFTLWLMTDKTDLECGQIDPATEIAGKGNRLKTR